MSNDPNLPGDPNLPPGVTDSEIEGQEESDEEREIEAAESRWESDNER